MLLNKFDILTEKLHAGIEFSSFVTSYKDRNTAQSVGRCEASGIDDVLAKADGVEMALHRFAKEVLGDP